MANWLEGVDNLLFVREMERWLRNHAADAEQSSEVQSVTSAPAGMSVDAIVTDPQLLSEVTTLNTGETG